MKKTELNMLRYIRRITLENYVNSKIDEFGTEWKCQVLDLFAYTRSISLTFLETARNNKIVFTALRKLTPVCNAVSLIPEFLPGD